MEKNMIEDNNVKLEILRLHNEGMSVRKIASIVSVPKSSVHKFLTKQTYKAWWDDHKKPIASGVKKDHHDNAERLDKSVYIVTSAQNSTFVHNEFLKSLEVMAKRYDAQIVVGTFSYNKNGFQNLEKSDGDWFDPKIQSYILDKPAILADGLMWCGELNILPTAANPLSGFHSYTKNDSGIIPHAKMQLESLPTRKVDKTARMLYTTGAVTKQNYIEKTTGQKAAFHHVYGALIVEVDNDGDWFVRQIVADSDSGCFYDLDSYYTPDGYTTDHNIEAINYGDIHAVHTDWTNVAIPSFAGIGNSMIDILKPKYQFVNDLHDHYSRNHHSISDPYLNFTKHHNINKHYNNVEAEIEYTASILKSMQRSFSKVVVVESNHDLALKRWLKNADYRQDPENAIFFLELQLAQYKALYYDNKDFSVFEYAVKTVDEQCDKVVFLKEDDSFVICEEYGGIECAYHGHLGNNGARGSVESYRKMGMRFNIGHTHSAAIKDGVYCAGVSGELNSFDYRKGGHSWSNSHIITYCNGKRTIVTLKNGKWRKDI